jgi:hypothetical protein
MGAWGTGPFDSDGALDYLGGLASRFGWQNHDGDLPAGSGDAERTDQELTGDLLAVTAGTTGEDRDSLCERAYAAAGLVAAALTGHGTDGAPSGTRLFAGLAGQSQTAEPLGLANHCSFGQMLTVDRALALRATALAASAALRDEAGWLSSWRDAEALREQLTRLEALLSLRAAPSGS